MRGQRPRGGHGSGVGGRGWSPTDPSPIRENAGTAHARPPIPDPGPREPEGRAFYTPADVAGDEYAEKLGDPGSFPLTRGLHASGYGGKLWTMRIFAGFGSAEETNERFKYLLANGNAGLSVAFDMPTLYGYDTDDPQAEGEFGTCGVAVSSLADMEVLFDGIPVDEVSTSMTIYSPAPMIWAMYLVNAEKRGIPLDQLRGTTQNDILKEYIAQKEYIFPPRPSLRLVVDTFEFGARCVPRGTRSRSAATTCARQARRRSRSWPSRSPTASPTWKSAVERGLTSTTFAPRLSFFFDVHNDLFEEVAKLRAARRVWATLMRERFGCPAISGRGGVGSTARRRASACSPSSPRTTSCVPPSRRWQRCSVARNRCTPTAWTRQWPYRRASARRGSRCGRSRSSPTRAARSTAVDPLGGSYYVEALTDRMEAGLLGLLPSHRRAGRHAAGDRAWLPAARDCRQRPIATSARSTVTSGRSSA